MNQLYLTDPNGFKNYCFNKNLAERTILNYLYELKKIPLDNPREYLIKNRKKRMLIFAFRCYLRYQKSIGKINAEQLYDLLETFKPPKGRGKTKKGNWYPLKEWEEIINNGPNRQARFGIWLGFTYGPRLSEIIFLRVQDINLEKRQIYIQTRPGWHPKFEKDRILPMKTKHIRIWKRWLNSRPSLNHDYIIWSGRKKTQVNPKTFQNWCKKARQGLKPHDLRRSFAKVLYYRSRDVYLVCELLGHESVATTTKYLGLEVEELQEKYDKAMP